MSSTQRSNNLAARMGRWSAQHRKKAIFGWLAFAIVLFAISITSPMKTIIAETSGPGESGRADTILYNDFKQPAGEEVLIQSRSLTTTDPAFKTAVEAVIAGVSRLDAVAKVKSPYAPGNSGFVSADKHSALVRIEIRGPSEDAVDKIDPIVARVAEVQKANPELYVGSFGESFGKALNASFGDDLKRAGLFSLPLTLIILLVAFGALVAAGIPLLLGLTSVLATMGLVAVISKVLPMSGDISAIVLLIGLAVGVDYTMFYLKREREERAAGRSKEAALEAAAATSGRSVLVSGSTVLVAMAGMFFTADATFASFGVATMTVVAVAMLGSLTVLPALLSKLGDKVDRGRLSFIHGRRRNGESRVWGAIIDRVLRRPLVSAVLAGGLLVAIAVPALQLQTAQPSIDTYPQKLLGTYNRIKAAYPGEENGTTVVIKAPNVEAPAVRVAVGELKRRALATGVMNEPIDVDTNAAKTVASITIATEGDGTDSRSNAALTALRDDIIPATVGALPESEVAVTGMTAYTRDFKQQMKTVAPLVFGFVLLFALSMDYHVFILSRIREAHDKGMSTDEAVAYGIKSTAGVVTSAAVVMVAVFAIFATLQAMILKQFGVGLAAAVLIDATLIRAILLPASMKLLGDWNWYLPKWLEWLPRLEHSGTVEKVEVPPVPAPSG